MWAFDCGSEKRAEALVRKLRRALASNAFEAVRLRDETSRENVESFLLRFVPDEYWPQEDEGE
jgi:hypothetical protein